VSVHEPTLNIPILKKTVFAHRGLPTRAPENTLAAFEATVQAGGLWIETDVDIIADGTPIIIHDSTLDRTTNRKGSFYPLQQADLASIDAGSWFDRKFVGERIPTLHQLIDFINEYQLNLNLEIKQNEQGANQTIQLINAVIKELARLSPQCQVIVSSFSQPILMAFHERAPAYALGVLFERATLQSDWLTVLELCGATYAHVENEGLTHQTVEQLSMAGYGVNVWTVNDIERAKELFAWGCTGVFTDITDKMTAVLKS